MSRSYALSSLAASINAMHMKDARHLARDGKPIFHFPNMCHICYKFGEGVDLKRCGACNMISYCSSVHQKYDWFLHRDFCRAISQIKKDWNLAEVFQSLKCSDASDESILTIVNEANSRLQYKDRLIRKVERIIKRKIYVHELEMIHFPRVCAVCFECRPELLRNCKKCPQTSFCTEHLNDPRHQEICPQMLTIFSDELKYYKSTYFKYIMTRLEVPHQVESVELPSCLRNFIETFIPESSTMKAFMLPDEAEYNFGLLARKISKPLSLLFAMQKLNLMSGNKLTIHIIEADMEEIDGNDWELILHFLPHLSELKMVFIAPDSSSVISLKSTNKACNQCRKTKKKLIVKVIHSMYEKYSYKECFRNPDMIAGFNTGFYAYPTYWDEAINVAGRLNLPLLFVTFNQFDAHNIHEKIISEFQFTNCVYNQQNPYCYLSPTRFFVDGTIFFYNQFMLLYKDLESNRA